MKFGNNRKKAKITLTCVALLSVFAGTLAFNSNRLPRNVYTLLPGNKAASITIGGIIYTTTIPNCTLTCLRSIANGPAVNVSSTTTDALSVTAFVAAGHTPVIATFAYCTLWQTAIVLCND